MCRLIFRGYGAGAVALPVHFYRPIMPFKSNPWIARLGDVAVLDALRTGDEDVYEAIFRTYYVVLCQFAVRYVKVPALAEDVVQDLLTELWTKRATLRIRESVAAYLFGAVRGRALNVIARQQTASTYAHRMGEDHPDDGPATGSTDDRCLFNETASIVQAAVHRLPPKRRAVFVLRKVTGMSYKEIAEVLDMSVKNVEINLRRAALDLRAVLWPHK
jgi:RNA polymerase sigma-70 factor (ECF subfamily)